MPAVAYAPIPELEPAPQPVSPSSAPATEDNNLEWRHVETYIDAFTGSEEIEQQRKARRKPRRYKSLRTLSGWTVAAGGLVFFELMSLVWLRTLNLGALRESAKLDQTIALTSDNISRTQRSIAALNSSPQIAEWAQDMGYRQAQLSEIDDVTSNQPYVASNPTPAGAPLPQ